MFPNALVDHHAKYEPPIYLYVCNKKLLYRDLFYSADLYGSRTEKEAARHAGLSQTIALLRLNMWMQRERESAIEKRILFASTRYIFAYSRLKPTTPEWN